MIWWRWRWEIFSANFTIFALGTMSDVWKSLTKMVKCDPVFLVNNLRYSKVIRKCALRKVNKDCLKYSMNQNFLCSWNVEVIHAKTAIKSKQKKKKHFQCTVIGHMNSIVLSTYLKINRIDHLEYDLIKVIRFMRSKSKVTKNQMTHTCRCHWRYSLYHAHLFLFVAGMRFIRYQHRSQSNTNVNAILDINIFHFVDVYVCSD